MGLLSRSSRPVLRTSRAPGDPLAERAAVAASRGDADEVERLLAEAGTDWDRRDRLVAVCAEHPGDWAAQWAAARPDSAAACTVAAAVACALAWRSRGHGRGHDLGEDEVDGWFAFLEQAEDLLGRAVRLDEGDPTPWAYGLLTARGLQVPAQEEQSRYAQLRRRDPLHRHGHWQAVRAFSPQWGGSAQDLLALGEEATRDAPAGAGVHAVWPELHVELWRWNLMQDPPDVEAADAYWTDPRVRDQVVQAWERWSSAPPLQPAWAVDDANLFAFCLFVLEQDDAAAEAFARTGRVVTEDPWVHLGDGDPVQEWRRAHQAVGAS